jgi:hypothetical protein
MNLAHEQFTDFWFRSKGVLFLATPHRGTQGKTISDHFLRTIGVVNSITYPPPQAPKGKGTAPAVVNLLEQKLQDSASSFTKKADAMMIASFHEDPNTIGLVR